MGNRYSLVKGTYYFGDPALVIKKKDQGLAFSEAMWDEVYQKKNSFQKITVQNITCYILLTRQGDGAFDGIYTDSGALMLIDKKELQNDQIFRYKEEGKGFKWLSVDSDFWVEEQDYILNFSFGYQLDTNG